MRIGASAQAHSTLLELSEVFLQSAAKAAAAARLQALTATPCDVQALKRCLEEHDGDMVKCEQHVRDFQQACSARPADGRGAEARGQA